METTLEVAFGALQIISTSELCQRSSECSFYVFSERQKMQLLWSRCVNTRGHKGTNIPCDLYIEHLNRRLKTVVRGMGSNVSPAKIQRAGKTLQPIQNVCEQFEKETAGQLHSDIGIPIHLLKKISS